MSVTKIQISENNTYFIIFTDILSVYSEREILTR